MSCGDNLLFRNKVLLAKLESTYGTDATPTGAEALLTRDVQINTFQGNTEEIDYDKPYLGSGKSIFTGPHTTISFTIDLAGSGVDPATTATAPAFGDLLKACKMTETVNASTDVTYTPNSNGSDSVTLYYYQDGQLHAIVGCRGTFTIELVREQLPKLNFTFTGLRVAPTTAAAPAPTGHSDFVEPLPVNDTYTSGFDLMGYSPNMESVSIDIGNNVVYRNVVGCEQAIITDRNATGQTVIELPPLASHDYDADVFNHTQSTFAVTHGNTAGNIVTLSSSQTQLISPSMSDSDGIVAGQFDMRFVPTTAGNDELSLVFT